MKAGYEKPMIEFEDYELNAAIASGCQTIISLGPGDDRYGYEICKEYIPQTRARSLPPSATNFYEQTCSCYLSAGDGTMFTS